ncbi:MAG: hypothetical protein ACRDRT_16005 [Pseudonocardiaceae bacterium]
MDGGWEREDHRADEKARVRPVEDPVDGTYTPKCRVVVQPDRQDTEPASSSAVVAPTMAESFAWS